MNLDGINPKLSVGDWLGYLGVIVGILGLVVSLLGFGFGLSGLAKAQNLAEATHAATERVIQNYASLDAAALVTAARNAAGRAGPNLTSESWESLARDYAEIRSSLIGIATSPGTLAAATTDALTSLAAEALDHHLLFVDLAEGAGSPANKADARRWLIGLDDRLRLVEVELRSGATQRAQ